MCYSGPRSRGRLAYGAKGVPCLQDLCTAAPAWAAAGGRKEGGKMCPHRSHLGALESPCQEPSGMPSALCTASPCCPPGGHHLGAFCLTWGSLGNPLTSPLCISDPCTYHMAGREGDTERPRPPNTKPRPFLPRVSCKLAGLGGQKRETPQSFAAAPTKGSERKGRRVGLVSPSRPAW